ncbi:MAG TPA: gas vesicle protein GvpG [Nocardioidaceae bacterium]|nr:gas vesicle protein GvpG [Nocardioidaceae bacterium]
MGLLGAIIGLPLAPVRGTAWAADQVRRKAEEEYYDPARIRLELEQVDRLREAGELSTEEATRLEDDLVDRLLAGRPDR